MALTNHETVFNALQQEFCPPLDSSLVAALLADVDFNTGPEEVSQAVDGLKLMFRELAAHAEVDSALNALSVDEADSFDGAEEDRETVTTNSLFGENGRSLTKSSNTTPDSAPSSDPPTSSTSDTSDEAFESPLGFLQAALPDVPTRRLRKALKDAQREGPSQFDDAEMDMWDIIASILTDESIKEMEERGFEGLIAGEEDEALARRLAEEDGEWPEQRTRKEEKEWIRFQPKLPKKKQHKQKSASVKITLGDVRQLGGTTVKKEEDADDQAAGPDRWTRVISLSSLLSTLFPSYPASFFQSQFHSPNYPDSYAACVAILQKIASSPLLSAPEELPSNGQGKDFDQKAQKDLEAPDRPRQRGGKPKRRARAATDGDHHPPLKHPTSSSTSSTSEDPQQDIEDDEQKTKETALLYNLLDILLPQYGLDPGISPLAGGETEETQRMQLISEIQLAVKATRGREDDTLDLLKLLRTLDEDRKERFPELMEEWYKHGAVAPGEGRGGRKGGVSYADSIGGGRGTKPLAKIVTSKDEDMSTRAPSGSVSLPTSPTLSRPARVSLSTSNSSMAKGKNKPSPYQWQAVPTKRAPEKQPYRILPHLPTYTRDVNGIKRRGHGAVPTTNTSSILDDSATVWRNGLAMLPDDHLPSSSNGRKTYEAEAEAAEMDYRRKMGENTRRRDELLREAARMWSRGSMGGYGTNVIGGDRTKSGRGRANVGGEVAWYFAERAREFQEMAKKESVNAARAMVLRKRNASGDKSSIDLHGTTVAEAIVIVEEILAEQPTSQARPLKIITGRGSHSVNQTSVLKPALKKRLVEDGWVVGMWEAGLVVRGRR
ncbi:hypothetical protein BKA70DRAFT_1255301 [Coprinopsis sp. MPI-PUGE-AT-0042]|nr:hypothetical protein BKA70DRAFT_1255301 [Coprinopsis sp. MPI-PUGE-AT-0042]